MTDDLDTPLTTVEIYARGERRLKKRDFTASDAMVFSSLRMALADSIAEIHRLKGVIAAQDYLLSHSKPQNEVCQCEKPSSTH